MNGDSSVAIAEPAAADERVVLPCSEPDSTLDSRAAGLDDMPSFAAMVSVSPDQLEEAEAFDYFDNFADSEIEQLRELSPEDFAKLEQSETELVALTVSTVEHLRRSESVKWDRRSGVNVMLLASQAKAIRDYGKPVSMFGQLVQRNGPDLGGGFPVDDLLNGSYVQLYSPVLVERAGSVQELGPSTCLGRGLEAELSEVTPEAVEALQLRLRDEALAERAVALADNPVVPSDETLPLSENPPLVPGGEPIPDDLGTVPGGLVVVDDRSDRRVVNICGTGSVLGVTACVTTDTTLELGGRDTGRSVLTGPIAIGETVRVEVRSFEEDAVELGAVQFEGSVEVTKDEPGERDPTVLGEHVWILTLSDEAIRLERADSKNLDRILQNPGK